MLKEQQKEPQYPGLSDTGSILGCPHNLKHFDLLGH